MPIKNHRNFLIALALFLTLAVATNLLPFITAFLAVILTTTLWFYDYFTERNIRSGLYLSWSCAIVVGILVGIYRPSDFTYPLVFSVQQLHEGGLPSSLYINIGKFLAGLIILYFLISYKSIAPAYLNSRYKQYAVAFLLVILIVVLAYTVLNLHFYSKPLKYVIQFGVVNLLVTCIAEEAFMRLLLQAQIQTFISVAIKQRFLQEFIPLVIATIVFVLTHFVKGGNLILVFAVAGFCYGLVYSLTKNIWACVLIHFAVNILHFSFLTYPLA